jgi:leucyl-tRNA synthetase
MVLKDGEVMSKSRGNTVDPDEVLSQYGADTLRLFILFAAPPEDQLEWNDSGLEGSWKFLNRIYRMVEDRYYRGKETEVPDARDAENQKLELERNKAIKLVTQSFEEGYKFNTAISHLMVLANAIDKYPYAQSDKPDRRLLLNQAIETLVLLLAPFAPHMAEEMWQMMGKSEATISHVAWPTFDENALKTSTIVIAVQVNGRVRAQIEVAPDMPQEDLRKLCLADARVMKYVQDAVIKKFIVVPNKLVSIVV